VVLQHGFLNQKCVRDATASLTNPTPRPQPCLIQK